MLSRETSQYDDRTILQYLLGAVPEEDACHIDELSITDDGFAARLNAAENDLVDSYVGGELTGEFLQRFQTHYLTSPVRREKVRFAESLRTLSERAPDSSGRTAEVRRRIWFSPAFAFAVTACCLLLAAAYLLYENGRLRGQLAQAPKERTLPEPRPASPQTPESPQAPAQPPTALMALVLSPETRGVGPVAAIALAPESEGAEFQLELESRPLSGYRVDLKDLAANTIVWRSGELQSVARRDSNVVPVRVPASLLKPGHYSLQLKAIPDRGAAELLGAYTFRVIR